MVTKAKQRNIDLQYILDNLDPIRSRDELYGRKELTAIVVILQFFGRGNGWVRPYQIQSGVSRSVIRVAMHNMTDGGLFVSRRYAVKNDATGNLGLLVTKGSEFQLTDKGREAKTYINKRMRKFSD